MGAGRKTETYTLAQDALYASGSVSMRNLQKGDLCGVIFGCKFSTIKECYAKKLFGLPAHHISYIKNIDPGLTLFLFNYSDRTLHGIFEAASEGKLNIDPIAWSPNGTDPTPFPAQVKVRARVRCEPLLEEKFGQVIAENYWNNDEKMFWFELDRGQTNKLLRLFSPSPTVRLPPTSKDPAPTSRKGIPASSLAEIGDSRATRVDKWSSLFKETDSKPKNLVNLGKTRGWETAADERKAQLSATQSGPSYSSVLRNTIDSSTNAVPSQGIENPWSSASRAHVKVNAPQQNSGIANNVIGPPRKEVSAEDTYSDFDWDASSSFKVHLEGLNKILEEPPTSGKDDFKRFEASSSSMVPNHWEDEKNPWDFQEKNIDNKSPCGSSYVSALTGDAVEDLGDDREKHRFDNFRMDMGSSVFVDALNELIAEVKALKVNQIQQADRMISLEMELLESRIEILRLQGRHESS